MDKYIEWLKEEIRRKEAQLDFKLDLSIECLKDNHSNSERNGITYALTALELRAEISTLKICLQEAKKAMRRGVITK